MQDFKTRFSTLKVCECTLVNDRTEEYYNNRMLNHVSIFLEKNLKISATWWTVGYAQLHFFSLAPFEEGKWWLHSFVALPLSPLRPSILKTTRQGWTEVEVGCGWNCHLCPLSYHSYWPYEVVVALNRLRLESIVPEHQLGHHWLHTVCVTFNWMGHRPISYYQSHLYSLDHCCE